MVGANIPSHRLMEVSTTSAHGLMAETTGPPHGHTAKPENHLHCPTVGSGVHLHSGTATLSGTIAHTNLDTAAWPILGTNASVPSFASTLDFRGSRAHLQRWVNALADDTKGPKQVD